MLPKFDLNVSIICNNNKVNVDIECGLTKVLVINKKLIEIKLKFDSLGQKIGLYSVIKTENKYKIKMRSV